MQDIECVFESMTGRGSIFISNLPAAQNVSLLQSKGIGAILSVARSGLLQHSKQDIPHYLYIPAQDHEDYALYLFFDRTFAFIENCRKETNVLVHCMAGISRSVTIVIAYLLKKYKYNLQQIITMMYRRRNKINPNPGFLQQLRKYAEKEGIQSDINSNFIRSLKEQSSSKPKRNVNSSKEKFSTRKVGTSLGHKNRIQGLSLKNTELMILDKQHQNGSFLKNVGCLQMKKIKSFQEPKKELLDCLNEEIECHTRRFDIMDFNNKNGFQKVSDSRCSRRGLSIEEKIKKVRDKIMRKEEGLMRNSAQFNPIYRRSPQKLENSSLQHQNRPKICIENSHTQDRPKEKTHNRLHSFSQANTQNDFSKPTSLLQSKISTHPYHHIKSENAEKDIFSTAIKMDSSLYSHLTFHKRVNSRFNQEPHF